MTRFDLILHPTDFAEEADQGFLLACTIARNHLASLLVVHVLPPHDDEDEKKELDEDAPDVKQCHESFRTLKCLEPDLPIRFRVVRGYPVGMILSVAHEEKADLIVIASSHRRPARLQLHGSVAEGVLRQSPCPVCCIRHPSN